MAANTSQDHTQTHSASLRSVLAILLLLGAATLFIYTPTLVLHHYPQFTIADSGSLHRIFAARTWTVECVLFFAAYLLAQSAGAVRWLSLAGRARRLSALGVVSLFLAGFVFYFGNQQFGAWDSSILIDTGWRQMIGQHPYTSFITPNPPGFNLALYAIFKVFGVTWNAQLYAMAIFCVATFLWMYWLLGKLGAMPGVAILLAFAVEAVTVLPVCFWWYNDTTSVMAAVFLLSCVVCGDSVRRAEAVPTLAEWASFALSFGLLALLKPNIAGLTLLPLIVLLFVAARSRSAFALAMAAGALLSAVLLLAGHVSVPAMLHCYRAAAIERGGLSRFGLIGYRKSQQLLLLLWTLALAVPLVVLLPRIRVASREGNWRRVAFLLLLLPALPVTLYGMATNGEVKDSEAAPLILAAGIVALVFRWTGPRVRVAFVAFLISILGANLYYGASRQRVFGIMNHGFYESVGADQPVHDGFFQDMHSTRYFNELDHEVERAKNSSPGPVFFGPRLEFEYADQKLPSPLGWPVYYQPGTSFARSDVPRLTQLWIDQNFQTLIFLKQDRTFYPDDLLQAIDAHYVLQPGYNDVDVYLRAR